MSGPRTTPPDAAHRALALELDAALANDPLVDELAFVPSATMADLFGPNARTHPPGAVVSAAVPGAFALVEHKLAVAVSALAPLHAFAREALRRADAADLDRTENQNENERGARDVGVDPDTRADALRLLLLVNGDHTTAWNRRKRRLIVNCAAVDADAVDAVDAAAAAGDAQTEATATGNKKIDLVSAELAFCALALSKFPKAQAAWAHRRWVVCAFDGDRDSRKRHETVPSQARFAAESEVAGAACLRKRLNYAAWAHRRWCALGRRGGALAAAGALREDVSLFDAELERTKRFVRVNVSDYCGLHYRQAVLTRRAERAAPPDWADEAEFTSSLIARFPGREALWAHRRFVFDARLRGTANDTGEALLAEELAFADCFVQKRLSAGSEDGDRGNEKDATPRTRHILHPSWAEHPAAEQARFAAAHALWALEAARRAGVRGAVGAAGARAPGVGGGSAAAAWPWGAAATRGMRVARVGGGASGDAGESAMSA